MFIHLIKNSSHYFIIIIMFIDTVRKKKVIIIISLIDNNKIIRSVRLSNGHGQYVFGWVTTKGENENRFFEKLRVGT